MPIEIVSGRSKSGKTQYIYSKIASLAKSGEEVMLIVPEQYTHGAERHLLELVGTIGDGGVEVFSFAHLATASESRMGYPHTPTINPVAKALIIREILSKNEFEFFRNAGRRDGFVDMVSGSIDEFKKYVISPEMLSDIADKTDSEVLKMKLGDLSVMYQKYEQKLLELYTDCDDPLTILSKRLKKSNIYKDKHIFLDEFDSFVPQEMEVIKALSQSCKSVTVALCLDRNEKNSTLFMPTLDTAKRLSKHLGNEVEHRFLEETHFSVDEISYLEENLYSFGSKTFEGEAKGIEVYALSNPLSEVENCALKIKNLVRQNGYMYRDIGVVCSDIEMYKRHIERVFDYAEIEYFTDVKDDIINHHLVRFVLGLMEIYIDDYSYNSVFNYLKTSFVDADPGHIALLECFIRKSGIRRLTWLNEDKWNLVLDANYKDDTETKHILCNIREKYILPLAKMHERIKGRNTVKADASILFDYINELKMPQTIASYIERFEDSGELRLAKEYEKIWDIIVSTLDEIVLLNSEEKVSPATFYELLVTAFSQHKVGFIPSAIDRVLIGNIERTRFDDIKVLFVLGVNETVFPVAPKPDGILGDADKEAMLSCGVEFSTTSSVAAYYSQYRAYRTFTMPSERLYVSYSKCGNDFKTMRKSYIVDRILKMFRLKENTEPDFNDIRGIYSKGPARELLSRNVAAYIRGDDVSPHWRNLFDYFDEKTDFAQKLNKFTSSNNLAHRISEGNLKKLIPMLSYTSVSKIERYMACKYAYFIDYIMRIERPKEDVVDALDIGNITHMILEQLSLEFASDMGVLSACKDSDVLKRTDMLIEEYMSGFFSYIDEISPRDAYVIKRLKNSIFLCFKAVRSQLLNSAFEPLGYEMEFNDASPLGAIDIVTQDGTEVHLTGKIDRADICRAGEQNFVRVIDYKTGSKELKLDDVFYGLNLQLMVYLSKLVDSNESYRHGGALYFPVSDLTLKSQGRLSEEEAQKNIDSALRLKGLIPCDESVLDAYDEKLASSAKRAGSSGKGVMLEDFETIDHYLKEKLSEICTDMLRGDFEIAPYRKNDFSPCEYCQYSSVCRFDASCRDNSYKVYRSISNTDEILKEMEVKLNVDTESTDSH